MGLDRRCRVRGVVGGRCRVGPAAGPAVAGVWGWLAGLAGCSRSFGEGGEDEPAGGFGGPVGPQPGQLDGGADGQAPGPFDQAEDQQRRADHAAGGFDTPVVLEEHGRHGERAFEVAAAALDRFLALCSGAGPPRRQRQRGQGWSAGRTSRRWRRRRRWQPAGRAFTGGGHELARELPQRDHLLAIAVPPRCWAHECRASRS
jgi:hypothetical protein